MRSGVTAVALVLFAAIGSAQTSEAPPVNLQGKLYRSVFVSGAGVLSTADLAAVPQPLRDRLARYLTRRSAFKSAYKSESTSWEMARSDAKKRALERSIVSLIEAPGIEQIAADLVAKSRIFYEWEGMHDGPLEEAHHAARVLESDPASPLAPWLCIFIAHRQRVAFETYEFEKNEPGMKTAAEQYRTFIARARAVPDPIFAALADDLDRQPFLYVKTTTHPRDFASAR